MVVSRSWRQGLRARCDIAPCRPTGMGRRGGARRAGFHLAPDRMTVLSFTDLKPLALGRCYAPTAPDETVFLHLHVARGLIALLAALILVIVDRHTLHRCAGLIWRDRHTSAQRARSGESRLVL